MKWLAPISILLAALFGAPRSQPAAHDDVVSFMAVDILIDSKQEPLAAYQLEFSVKSRNAKVVGVEGGGHPAFKDAPFYDPKAMQQERVILAAFSTSAKDKLPKGKTRVATIHLQVTDGGRPALDLKLDTTATADGNRISAAATFEERKAK